MDKFVEKAFADADAAIDKKITDGFQKVMDNDIQKITLNACIGAGLKQTAELIRVIKEKGLVDALKCYEVSLIANGYLRGFNDGRESMLEDMNHE